MTNKKIIDNGMKITPNDYLAIRVNFFRVKKGLFGFRDKKIGSITLIPNTRRDALKVFKEIESVFKKHGVQFKVD